VKEFMQRNDLRAARGGFADLLDRSGQIVFRVGRAFHLHESDGEFVSHKNSLA